MKMFVGRLIATVMVFFLGGFYTNETIADSHDGLLQRGRDIARSTWDIKAICTESLIKKGDIWFYWISYESNSGRPIAGFDDKTIRTAVVHLNASGEATSTRQSGHPRRLRGLDAITYCVTPIYLREEYPEYTDRNKRFWSKQLGLDPNGTYLIDKRIY